MEENKASGRKIFFWLLLVVFLWIAVTYFAKTEQILKVLSTGRWYFIGLAVLCQVFYYPFYAYFLESIFKIFKINLGIKNILPVYIASKFTDVALPVATLGEVAIFVRNGKKNNFSPLDVGIAISLALFYELVAFIIIGLITLMFLFLFKKPVGDYTTVTLLILTVVVLVTILILVRITSTLKPLNNFFLSIIRFFLRLVGQKSITNPMINETLMKTGTNLKKGRGKLLPSLWLSTFSHLINLVTFALIFLAFTGQFNIWAILSGFITGLLFTIVSITPQGVGVAETAMIATMHAFGIDISAAAVITLAFRGLLYWLPLFVGFYVFSRLELNTDK